MQKNKIFNLKQDREPYYFSGCEQKYLRYRLTRLEPIIKDYCQPCSFTFANEIDISLVLGIYEIGLESASILSKSINGNEKIIISLKIDDVEFAFFDTFYLGKDHSFYYTKSDEPKIIIGGTVPPDFIDWIKSVEENVTW